MKQGIWTTQPLLRIPILLSREALHGINIEREANQFAAELLMPEEEIRNAWKNLPEDWFDQKPLEIIAKQFKVSEGALFIRLKQLKGIGLGS